MKDTANSKIKDNFFSPVGERGKNHVWGERNWIQLAVFLATIGIGIQFFIYVHQAAGNGAVTVLRPPGGEGFLPIGVLIGWKLFVQTGIWDSIHPAAMVTLGFTGFISLSLHKSFCGCFCPVGTLSEWLWALGRHLFGKNYKLPVWLDFPLRSLKYLLLGFFVKIIFSMSSPAILGFLQSPYYFFAQMSTLTLVILTILVYRLSLYAMSGAGTCAPTDR